MAIQIQLILLLLGNVNNNNGQNPKLPWLANNVGRQGGEPSLPFCCYCWKPTPPSSKLGWQWQQPLTVAMAAHLVHMPINTNKERKKER